MQSVTEIPFVGGHVALDFVNTAEERGNPVAEDALTGPADLRLWGQRYGLIARSASPARDDQHEFQRARDTRELLYELFFARAHGRTLPRPRLARLKQLAVEAYQAGDLELTPDGSLEWRWSRSDLSTVRHVAVASAVTLLRAEPSARLKQCPGDHCGWLFIDTTKRGNRRWCSMSECGQEAKNRKRRKPASHSQG